MKTKRASARGGLSVTYGPELMRDPVGRFAVGELYDHLAAIRARKGAIELSIDPKAAGNSRAEAFRIVAGARGSVRLIGADAAGLLWAVRDFQHYYCRDWLAGRAGKLDAATAPAIDDRGLWTWQYSCYDPYAYVDRASEWKYNTVIFWNRGVSMDAARLNEYAHRRGVKIWWGFSWGWVAEDFKDASPELAQRLLMLYEKQKREISPDLANLDLLDEETPQALMDYVLDVFEKQYSWIPGLDGIYFQSATEAINPRLNDKTSRLGEALAANILPIIRELHRRRPKMRISCGIHNTGDEKTYEALKQLPAYVNILWEAGVHWAPTREIARTQMALRGKGEDFGGVYRIVMNCGMIYQDNTIRGEKDRAWLPRVEKLWAAIEDGAGPDQNAWPFTVEGKEVAYPCSRDWRPPAGRGMLDNDNIRQLLDWSGDLAAGPPRRKGLFVLVEAALMDLKMRRAPAMAAELLWNPLADRAELERRCGLIWRGKVGGWAEPANPYWQAADSRAGEPADGKEEKKDLGDMYDQMGAAQ